MSSRVVWKYSLEIKDRQALIITVGAEIKALQMQDRTPTIWALVNPNAPKMARYFLTFGTGYELPEEAGEYVGTYQYGSLVFHVFEEITKYA